MTFATAHVSQTAPPQPSDAAHKRGNVSVELGPPDRAPLPASQ